MSCAVSLTACASADAGAGGRQSCAATPGVSAGAVNAGLLYSDSGPAGTSLPAFRAGIDARFGLANANGGVNGRKITYAWRDDQGEAGTNLTQAQDLIANGGILGLIEGPNGTDAGSADYLAKQRLPVVGLGSDSVWLTHNNMFSWLFVNTTPSTVFGQYVHAQGGTRAAMVDLAGDQGSQGSVQQLAVSLNKAGVATPLNIEIAPGTASYAAIASRIKDAHVDTLAGVVLPDSLASLAPALRAIGVDLKVALLPLGYDQALLQKLGPAMAGATIYMASRPFEDKNQAQQVFLTAMTAYAPEVQVPTQESALWGWLAADLFLDGVQAAGQCPSRESLATGLNSLRGFDGGGLLPAPVDISRARTLPTCYAFVKVSADGKRFEPVPVADPCGKPIQ
ncbi:ABC transporter substrate-binding protein [Frankia sp. AgB1.9]|uniref:ABC transporter substrate-binding protein n=1 Tax=unclassified Frankia TaxID=2632575 RepID=UPI001933EC9B|nr:MULTISPECIES: ABC transporter substrate-binding protein [unclassified Frankia]MBL7492641.1 ABC transporter substrate-binding protein [Frankia sp. AgW1.1]MBL7549344.1 ABC transporter substrate-binding protein [Frankia sp. AgB1.9]MBL7619189.1 ABC transporter substrate-binding protein [Frankia sp. AgB1.8]